ncbi:MAG: serine/threonine protein phosphatase [Lachnospiraceae bacterium]|nr:serine/threonine protein phosphatase [Lachnospiraceae bacterium]
MSLFAISDLHLSAVMNKPMDIFGDNWAGHTEKIEKNWKEMIKEEDMVLIPGDISWGMSLDEAIPDLEFIDSLPGKKVLMSGNHDYWWTSVSKLNKMFETMTFVKNTFFNYGDTAICGSRGWVCPNDTAFTKHDEKIYNRELIRLKLSLDGAVRAGYKDIICMMHYPPANDKKETSGFTEIFEQYGIKEVIYGHLHGKYSFPTGIKGEVNGVNYRLVSADYLDFKPLKIK